MNLRSPDRSPRSASGVCRCRAWRRQKSKKGLKMKQFYHLACIGYTVIYLFLQVTAVQIEALSSRGAGGKSATRPTPPVSGYRRVDMQDCHERQSLEGREDGYETEACFPIFKAGAAGHQGG